MHKRNSIIILLSLVFGFFSVAFLSIPRFFGALFGKNQKPLKENTFLDSINFIANIGPKSFWKKPSGVKIGRSFSTFLHYIFFKHESLSGSNTTKKTSTRNRKGFTILEMIVSITLFSLLLVAAFSVFGNIGISRMNVTNELDINKDIYFSVEKFAALVKEGGTVDYEEYWNRQQTDMTTSSGHFLTFSEYGNTTNLLYKCVDATQQSTGVGCAQPGKQKYGEYQLQFINYGSSSTSDDDEDLGLGPSTFTNGAALPELYLINKTTLPHERLFFRFNVKKDPLSSNPCVWPGTTSGCVGNLQMLRLVGSDSNNDGKTDTWSCNKDFCTGKPTGADTEWVDVFPSYINVKEVKFYISPNKDVKYAWKDPVVNAPYVRVALKLGFSAERKKQLRGKDPTIDISTTINLE